MVLFYNITHAQKTVTLNAIHPEWRTEYFPNNTVAISNPVSLLTPTKRDKSTQPFLSHDFQVSNFKDFSKIIDESIDRKSNFYRLPKPLSKGTWYWRTRVNNGVWQGPFTFKIDNTTWTNNYPSSDEFFLRIPKSHPRVLARASKLEMLRKNIDPKLKVIITNNAANYFNITLPNKEWGGKFFKGQTRVFQNKKFPEDHIKAQATGGVFHSGIAHLSKAYILTNDKKYALEAIKWAEKVSSFPIIPEMVTEDIYYQDSFSYAALLSSLTLVYDTFYDLLTLEQKNAIETSLKKRINDYYAYFCNRLESRSLDNHAWQHTFLNFFEAVLSVAHELNEAEEYIKYAYDVWHTRQPIQSTTDGGWMNGKYFGVNIGTFMRINAHFEKITGVNYYQHPWYKNNAKWIYYNKPFGSMSDGFDGDGYEDVKVEFQSKYTIWLAKISQKTGDELAGSMSRKHFPTNNSDVYKKYLGLLWPSLSELEDFRPIASGKDLQMKQSALFEDIGIVNFNTDINDIENNLMVSLRSSPWGNFGHNLANQNAFTIVHKGKQLFVPYRYRHGGAHGYACYRHTRGHNSVLINGKGQPVSAEAYGYISKYLAGEKLYYAAGNASNAYHGKPSPQWLKKYEKSEIEWYKHMDDSSLTKFKRHLIVLKPSLVIVYDELEASKPATWDWILHCRKNMELEQNGISIPNEKVKIQVVSSEDYSLDLRKFPLIPPFNVDRRGGKEPTTYKSIGTHLYVTPKEKTKALRLISFIQVGSVKGITEKEGTYTYGNWSITPELDINKKAQLRIHNKKENVSFLLNNKNGKTILNEGNQNYVGEDLLPRVIKQIE